MWEGIKTIFYPFSSWFSFTLENIEIHRISSCVRQFMKGSIKIMFLDSGKLNFRINHLLSFMNSIEGDAMKWQFCSVSFNARLQNPEIKFVSAPISKIYIVRLDHGDGRAQWPWEGGEAAGRVEWAQQVSEGEAAAGLTLSLNQNHRNFGAWQKSFQTDQGTHLDHWELGVQGLKVICRLTCMRDSCSVDGTCQKPPPGHHCSEVQKGPPPTQNGRQRAQPPLTEGTRATKLHHQTIKLLHHFHKQRARATMAITTMTSRGQCWAGTLHCCTPSLCFKGGETEMRLHRSNWV